MIPVPRLPVSSDILEWSLVPSEPGSCTLALEFLDGPEEAFRPGEVSVWWSEGCLWLLASLMDDELLCTATGNNQPLWELGDVFETFLKIAPAEEYIEVHSSPTGHWLQLRFPNAEVIKQLHAVHQMPTEFMVEGGLFETLVRPISGGWQVFSRIPDPRLVTGCSFQLSCSRYDAGTGRPPVLSSTSRHTEINFHDQRGWTSLVLLA